MDERKINYKKIVKQMINRSFPRLNDKFIWVNYFPYRISWASAAVFPFGFGAWIILFPVTKGFSKQNLRGLLAHELSHYDLISKMGFFEFVSFGFSWLFFHKSKVEFETAADKYAIEKGYGREIYSRVMVIEKKRTKEELKKRRGRGYLSSKEIKTYAKKVGKW